MADFVMPSLGATMDEGVLLAWRKAPGDRVRRGDILAEVQTDKADIEVEAFASGILEAILVEPGTRVPVGAVLARIRDEAPAPLGAPERPPAPPPAEAQRRRPPPAERPAPPRRPSPEEAPGAGAAARPRASPIARRLAFERGLDLAAIAGTGPDGAVVLADVERASEAAAAPAPAETPAPPAAAASPALRASPAEPAGALRRASPAARALAHALGLDLARVTGSGPHGAIGRGDVERAAAAVAAAIQAHFAHPGAAALPEVGASPAGAAPAPPTPEPPGRAPSPPPPAAAAAPGAGASAPARPAPADRKAAMRRAIADAMALSKREIPHYYLSHAIDLGRALAFLEADNAKRPVTARILPAALLLKAVAVALRGFPELNAVWTGAEAEPRPGIHVGPAIALREGGLVAPALHHADQRPLLDLMEAFRDLVGRARAGKLSRAELTEATITVTSLGDRGVDAVFGVINPPQTALVGLGKVAVRPWVRDGKVEPRPVLTATLSADHRVSDGHRGALFLDRLAALLQEPESL